MKLKTNWLYALPILLLVSCGDKKATEQEKEKKDTVQASKEEEKKPEAEAKTGTADLLIGEWELVKETDLSGGEVKGIKGILKINKEGFEDNYQGAVTKGKWELRKTEAINADAIDGFLMYLDGTKEMKPENAEPRSITKLSQDELVFEFMGTKTYKRKK
ncbi:hypothetical protein AD998_05395 [bacterium 336/3]|nr:hypothetical protein AD998_05395 [bacterium 336/3]